MAKIILISGKQGSGKSTLQDTLRYVLLGRGKFRKVVRLNFADVLYEMHDAVLQVIENYGFSTPKKDGVLLQLLGTEWGRKVYGDSIWVDILKHRISTQAASGVVFIIADCRFRNEFDAFPEALRVRLFADEETRKARTDSWRENTNHLSEIDLDSYAGEGKFDLLFNTTPGIDSPEHCAEIILAQLQKQSWIEKRK